MGQVVKGQSFTTEITRCPAQRESLIKTVSSFRSLTQLEVYRSKSIQCIGFPSLVLQLLEEWQCLVVSGERLPIFAQREVDGSHTVENQRCPLSVGGRAEK